jgi:hypothetical protein
LLDAGHVGRQRPLLGSKLACRFEGILHIALAASRLIPFEPALRLAETIERRLRLRATVPRAVGRGLLHRVGRFAQVSRRIAEILALLFALQLLEPPGGLLDLLRQLPLRVAAAATAAGRVLSRHPAQPLGFL